MLKVFYIKADEGKMLSAAIIVFNPKASLALLFFFFLEVTFSSFSSLSLHCSLESC